MQRLRVGRTNGVPCESAVAAADRGSENFTVGNVWLISTREKQVERMVTLVTGFEPFGGGTFNISELVVRSLTAVPNPNVVTAVLPAAYRQAAAQVAEMLREHQPDTAILLGQSRSARSIHLERLAVNLDDSAHPDNDGEVRRQRPVLAQAPATYRSSLPLTRMTDVAERFGETVKLSDDAGRYVCNHTFFVAAHLSATELPQTRCGFVHLPVVSPSSNRVGRFTEVVRAWTAAAGDAEDAAAEIVVVPYR